MLAEFWYFLSDPKCNLKKLYDLANDVGETLNVADAMADIVESMTGLADAKRAELGDASQKVEGRDVRAPGRAQ